MCREARSSISLRFAGRQLASRGENLTPPAKFSMFAHFRAQPSRVVQASRGASTTILRYFQCFFHVIFLCIFVYFLFIYFQCCV
jgi:hypothetical protein